MTSTTQTMRPNRVPLVTLFTANAISLVGSELTALAVPWFVLQTTGSAALTGITGFFSALPFVIGGLFGGAIADRLGYKRTSVLADLAGGGTVALIPLLYSLHLLPFPVLLLLVFLSTLLSIPGSAARRAILPALAERANVGLEQVNATYSTIQNAAVLVGPPVAGLLVVVLGASNVLWLDAASFFLSALLVGIGVSVAPVARTSAQRHYLADVRDGIGFILRNALLRTIVLTAVVSNFVLAPLFTVIMPVFVKQVYNDPTKLGLLLAAFGGGATIGSLGYGAQAHRWRRRALFIVGFGSAGVGMAVVALLPPFAVLLASMLVMGITAGPLNPLIQTLVQERTPSSMLARVFGTLTALATAASPLGILLGGTLVALLGVQGSLIVIAIGMLLVGASLWFSRSLRHMERPTDSEMLAAPRSDT